MSSLSIGSARESMTIYTRSEIFNVDIFLVTSSVLYVCIFVNISECQQPLPATYNLAYDLW